ncbi:MAG: hypothetical protein KDG58_21285, partial [Anaerolineae bacterium]|nr:hypothetical protein [Anaerolineae bacterium]
MTPPDSELADSLLRIVSFTTRLADATVNLLINSLAAETSSFSLATINKPVQSLLLSMNRDFHFTHHQHWLVAGVRTPA